MKFHKKPLKIVGLILGIALILFTAFEVLSRITSTPALVRLDTWAQPISKTGLKNLYKVSENLYRGAEPQTEGFQQLQDMGIKTIIDLEAFQSDAPAILATKTHFNYVPIPMNTWDIKDEEVIKFLQVVSDKNNYPIFVHCQYGSDRTGVTVAMYRMIFEGWTKEQALSEMTGGGYGFHPIWQNIVDYIHNVDVEKIKKAVGL